MKIGVGRVFTVTVDNMFYILIYRACARLTYFMHYTALCVLARWITFKKYHASVCINYSLTSPSTYIRLFWRQLNGG